MMAIEEYNADLAQTHWWWKARYHILKKLLNTYLDGESYRIIDVGCGTGAYLPLLSRFGHVTGIDISEEALKLCPPDFTTQQASCYELPLTDGAADLVVSMDMLEHLKDDSKALREIHRVLDADAGLVIISVPGLPSLWSAHDERLGHYRRYTKAGLSGLLRQSGFDVLEIRYVMSLLYPAMWLQRRLSSQPSNGTPEGVKLPGWMNRTMEIACNMETTLPFRMPFGPSLFAISRVAGK